MAIPEKKRVIMTAGIQILISPIYPEIQFHSHILCRLEIASGDVVVIGKSGARNIRKDGS